MTPDKVTQRMGAPTGRSQKGNLTIYGYPRAKITFLNEKVAHTVTGMP